MSSATIRWWLLGSVLVALAVAPFLARGDAATRKLQTDNTLEIKAMSDSEWARTERNFEAFKKLSPNEQEKILAFHRQLTPSVEHKAALKTYVSWLATLEPYQRDRLNQVNKPSERIALIKDIMVEQQERSAEREIPESIKRFHVPVISTGDLERVMEEIESQSRSSFLLGLDQQKALKPLTGIRRYYELLKILSRSSLNSETTPILQEPPVVFSRVAAKIDELVEDSTLRERFNQSGNREFSDRHLAGMLMKSMLVELFQTNEGRKPSSAELEELFDRLPEAEQDQLLNLEAADFQADLSKRLVAESEVSVDDLKDLFVPPEMRYGGRFRKRWESRGDRPYGPGRFGPDRGDRDGKGPPNGGPVDGRRPPRPEDGPLPRRPENDREEN